MKQPKIYIPVSHNGGGDVKSGWAVCMVSAFNGCHVVVEELGGSHADRACNNMANRFLRTDCDVMLIIDCDTIFTARDVQRLLGHFSRGHKAIWGIYPKKQDDAPPCLNTWPVVPPPDEHGLVNVRRSGRGFLMVHREVFEKLKEDNGGPALRFHNHEQTEWAFFRSGVVSGELSPMLGDKDADGYPIREWITEDWYFCEEIRKHLGIPTLVDTGIALAHIGSKTYTFPANHLARVDSHISSWQDIHGWFDYEDLYRRLVDEIPNGGSFMEVGCWLGRSIGAFHAFAKEKNKVTTKCVCDTFEGDPANAEQAEILQALGGSAEKTFRKNMAALMCKPTVVTLPSALAAETFRDKTFDAVFIDADHRYEAVKADIFAWFPKVKSGGSLSGHDYDEPGVLQAVGEFFISPVEKIGRCWYVKKP